MKIVHEKEKLLEAWAMGRTEAQAAFGNPEMFMERYCQKPRHIEIQVVGDKHGHYTHLGERECSIQRRHQKVIEEAPSVALPEATRQKMQKAAVKAIEAIGYYNVGTLEFLLDTDGSFYFMEMNTRLQVEHPVTELVTGIDIVREQLRIAAGQRLPVTGRADRSGHAIEVRINAEDTAHGFRPAPGRLERFRAPLGPGVRTDTAVADGVVIPPFYDSMIAKVIVHDVDRPAAIVRAVRALEELEVAGVPTTREVAIDVLRSPGFVSGDYSTGYLAEMEHRFPSLGPR